MHENFACSFHDKTHDKRLKLINVVFTSPRQPTLSSCPELRYPVERANDLTPSAISFVIVSLIYLNLSPRGEVDGEKFSIRFFLAWPLSHSRLMTSRRLPARHHRSSSRHFFSSFHASLLRCWIKMKQMSPWSPLICNNDHHYVSTNYHWRMGRARWGQVEWNWMNFDFRGCCVYVLFRGGGRQQFALKWRRQTFVSHSLCLLSLSFHYYFPLACLCCVAEAGGERENEM